jgi:hypothetical protein
MPIRKPVRVGQDAPTNPSAFLVADQVDLDAGQKNGPARIMYWNGNVSREVPLQQFFKFGVWYDVEEQYKSKEIDADERTASQPE